jgi:hypothetical protein
MKTILLFILLLIFAPGYAHSQSFDVNDLISMAYLPSKDVNHFMNKRGFIPVSGEQDTVSVLGSFMSRPPRKKKTVRPKLSLELINKGNSKFIAFHTSSLEDFRQGEARLIKTGFFYDTRADMVKDSSMLFQKRNISVEATMTIKDSLPEYTFMLEQKALPDITNIKYAEDLLVFTSHEYLVSFFGEENVKKDQYYFSEKELKKCSVLFAGSNRQIVFVWDDENNLNHLAYILVSNTSPIAGAKRSNELLTRNEWRLHNGMYPGMSIEDLIKLNESDFQIYGNQSELAYMVKPGGVGKIDFKKTAVLMSCRGCNNDTHFDSPELRARDIVRQDFPMYVFDIILYPAHP